MKCDRCGNSLNFSRENDKDSFWYREFVFHSPIANFWFPKDDYKIAKEFINNLEKMIQYKLCIRCSYELSELLDKFIAEKPSSQE